MRGVLRAPVEGRREDGFCARGGATTRLEAFVDAAFAFALTLLVISLGTIPSSSAALVAALKQVPAFAASFLLVASFWRGHVDWSDRFGLENRAAQRLSLLLVFLVLVFVYPLRMVFESLFAFISGGWLSANLRFESIDDVRLMFAAFALAYGSMGTAMLLLYRTAWRARDLLALDASERELTLIELKRWGFVPLFAILSLLACQVDAWVRVGVPGFVFFGLHGSQTMLNRRRQRLLAAKASTDPTAGLDAAADDRR